MKAVVVKNGDKGKDRRGDGKGEKRACPEGTPPSSHSQKKTLATKEDPFTLASTLFEAPSLEGT